MPKRIFFGTVVSSKCTKTVKVLVLQVYKHRLYKKVMKMHKKYTVHDESNSHREGDKVMIQEHRPISATKRWIIVK